MQLSCQRAVGCLAVVLATWFAATAARTGEGTAWLGVIVDDAVDGGVLVVAVHPSGPADKAGLRGGDVLLRLDGLELAGQEAFVRLLQARVPGERVRFELLRGSNKLERQVELGARSEALAPLVLLPRASPPAAALAPVPGLPPIEAFGIGVVDVTPDLRVFLGASAGAGVLVTRVQPGTPAAQAGLEVGDILLALGEEPVRTVRDVEVLLGAPGRLVRGEGENLVAQLIRGRTVQSVEVELPRVESGSAARTAALRRATIEEELYRLRSEAERLRRRIQALERALAADRGPGTPPPREPGSPQ